MSKDDFSAPVAARNSKISAEHTREQLLPTSPDMPTMFGGWGKKGRDSDLAAIDSELDALDEILLTENAVAHVTTSARATILLNMVDGFPK